MSAPMPDHPATCCAGCGKPMPEFDRLKLPMPRTARVFHAKCLPPVAAPKRGTANGGFLKPGTMP